MGKLRLRHQKVVQEQIAVRRQLADVVPPEVIARLPPVRPDRPMPTGRYRLNGVVPPDVWAMMSPAEQAETLANYRVRIFPATRPNTTNQLVAAAGLAVGVLLMIAFLIAVLSH